MFEFVLIGLSLVLLGIVGLQFTYLFYLDKVFKERKKYLQEVERELEQRAEQLEAANVLIAEQRKLIATIYPEKLKDDVWAEVIDER